MAWKRFLSVSKKNPQIFRQSNYLYLYVKRCFKQVEGVRCVFVFIRQMCAFILATFFFEMWGKKQLCFSPFPFVVCAFHVNIFSPSDRRGGGSTAKTQNCNNVFFGGNQFHPPHEGSAPCSVLLLAYESKICPLHSIATTFSHALHFATKCAYFTHMLAFLKVCSSHLWWETAHALRIIIV